MRSAIFVLVVGVAAGGCAPGARQPTNKAPEPRAGPVASGDAFPSAYVPFPSTPTLIRGGTILTAAGDVIPGGQVLMVDGKIAAVGAHVDAPAGVTVVEATGKYVTPGLIDDHSHLGAGPSPAVPALANVNERTNPSTPEVWVEHSVWPQDPGFNRARAGGITTLQILPGSANLIGGRSVVLRNVPARTVQEMKFPGAPYGMKMACGENPKRVYATRGPSTLMGNVAGYRAAFIRAREYKKRWDDWEKAGRDSTKIPALDLGMETMKGVLEGTILIHNHCYTAEQMQIQMDVFREFGVRPRSFHHAVEAYKIADLLARDSVSVSIWADWWGFKMEAWDAVNANLALVQQAGARAIVHSDDANGIQRLNQEAAKGMLAGREIGIQVTDDQAIRWVTANPAWALGIQDRVGTLEAGKIADVVVWDRYPFSVYARAEKVFIDGALVYDRTDPSRQAVSDFELGVFPGESR
ncbi:MAG: amidohydrolase family protein [Gemmatimonadetes bacterium]|nr:amidohydrolase family protein [Gemmatimonadota bacterium]